MRVPRDWVLTATLAVVKSPDPPQIVAEQRLIRKRPAMSSLELNDVSRHPASLRVPA